MFMECVKLTIRPIGRLHRQVELIPTDPIIWYKVEPLDRDVFIDVIFGGNTYEASQIRGRKEEYKTPDEALAVLQCEMDAGTPGVI